MKYTRTPVRNPRTTLDLLHLAFGSFPAVTHLAAIHLNQGKLVRTHAIGMYGGSIIAFNPQSQHAALPGEHAFQQGNLPWIGMPDERYERTLHDYTSLFSRQGLRLSKTGLACAQVVTLQSYLGQFGDFASLGVILCHDVRESLQTLDTIVARADASTIALGVWIGTRDVEESLRRSPEGYFTPKDMRTMGTHAEPFLYTQRRR